MRRKAASKGLGVILSVTLAAGLNPAAALAFSADEGAGAQSAAKLGAVTLTTLDDAYETNIGEYVDVMSTDKTFLVGELPEGFAPDMYEGFDGNSLVQDVDYTLSYLINQNGEWVEVEDFNPQTAVGVYCFKVTGVGKYDGSVLTDPFTIIDSYDLKYLQGTVDDKWFSDGRGYLLKGEAIPSDFSPTISAYRSSDGALVNGEDFKVVGFQRCTSLDADGNALAWEDITSFDGSVAGRYRFTVQGIGKYHGTVSLGEFEVIDSNDVKIAQVDCPAKVVVKKGESYTPAIKVTANGKALKEGVDFKVTYRKALKGYDYYAWDDEPPVYDWGDQVSAPLARGVYHVVVEGMGGYLGTNEGTVLEVGDASFLDTATFKLSRTLYPCTGNPVEMDCALTDSNGVLLEEGKDYRLVFCTAEYNDIDQYGRLDADVLEPFVGATPSDVNGEDDFYFVYAEGMGEYSGKSAVKSFDIVDAHSLRAAVVTFEDAEFARSHVLDYTGEKAVPKFQVTFPNEGGDILLAEGKDYTVSYSREVLVEEDGYSYNDWVEDESPTVPGSYRAQIAPAEGSEYTESTSFDFQICKSVAKAQVSIANQVFTGNALEPEVTVTLDGETLQLGSDYEVSYEGNTNAGTASVTVTGKGNYAGTATAQFVIAPAPIDKATLSGVKDATYADSAVTQPDLVVSLDGKELKEGADYAVSYADNDAVGTATVVVTGKGNYTGSAEAQFKISAPAAPVSLQDAELVLTKARFTYTGEVQKPAVKTIGGKALEEGVDYVLFYSNASSKAAGAYTVQAVGQGSYVGISAEATYTIAKASQKITAKNASASAKAKKSGKVKKLAKNVAVNLKKKAKVSAKTAVKYAKANKAGGKKIVVNKRTGKVTLKKGLKAGTYKVRVKLTAAASKNYKAAKAKTITLTVKVK